MIKIAVIENKISAVRKYLKILQRYKKFSQEALEKNIDLRGALERYLYLVVQATIDLSEAMIAYKDLRKPTTMSEAFYILNEEKIISDKLTKAMIKMTGFRNIVTHDYEKLDYDIVYDVLQKGLKDIEKFLKEISSYI